MDCITELEWLWVVVVGIWMIWMNEVMEFCTVRENIQKKRIVQL